MTQKLNTSLQTSLLAIALLVCTPLLGTAHAAESNGEGAFFGKSAEGKWIIGGKVANIDPNIADVSDADGVGIVLGYEFARPVGDNGSSTFELEYITTDTADLTPFGPSFGQYETDVVNLFFTYRTAGKLYFKVKGGLSYVDRNVLGAPFGVLTDSGDVLAGGEDVSLAAGLGFGLRVTEHGAIEIEYSQDSGNIDNGIFGVNAFLKF